MDLQGFPLVYYCISLLDYKDSETNRHIEYNMKLNRIKAVLAEKGISQTWLAKQLNKSFSMVNAYACNRIQPNLETLQQIAVILQVDLKDLITDKEER